MCPKAAVAPAQHLCEPIENLPSGTTNRNAYCIPASATARPS